MKGLDTPVLVALLRGRPEARRLLKALHGEELCTTEWNLFELEAIARSDPSGGKERRVAALERLRRKLTVLPIDERAIRAAVGHMSGKARPLKDPLPWLVAGALEANGCSEWYTAGPARLPAGFGVAVRIPK